MKRLEKLCIIATILAIINFGLLYAQEATADTLMVYGGKAISNSITDQKAAAWGIEQVTKTKYGTWNLGYINEGHIKWDKRDGIYALPRWSADLTDHLKTSFGIGPYLSATTITQPDGIHYIDHYRWDILGTATVDYTFSKQYVVSARWGHTMYTGSKDTDLFLFGVGYRFN